MVRLPAVPSVVGSESWGVSFSKVKLVTLLHEGSHSFNPIDANNYYSCLYNSGVRPYKRVLNIPGKGNVVPCRDTVGSCLRWWVAAGKRKISTAQHRYWRLWQSSWSKSFPNAVLQFPRGKTLGTTVNSVAWPHPKKIGKRLSLRNAADVICYAIRTTHTPVMFSAQRIIITGARSTLKASACIFEGGVRLRRTSCSEGCSEYFASRKL